MYAALEHFRPHHQELRTRLLRSIAVMALASAGCYAFSRQIAALCMAPLFAAHPQLQRLVYTNLTEAFIVYIKLAIICGLMLSFPHTLFQAWRFVAPGLLAHERRTALRVAVWGSLLFAAGVVFAYAVVLPRTLVFFMGYAGPNLHPLPKLGLYITFTLRLALALGLAFEIPFLMVMTCRAGLMSPARFRARRLSFYAAIVVLAFLLAAGDFMATALASAPLFGLYEAGIALGALFAARGEGK